MLRYFIPSNVYSYLTAVIINAQHGSNSQYETAVEEICFTSKVIVHPSYSIILLHRLFLLLILDLKHTIGFHAYLQKNARCGQSFVVNMHKPFGICSVYFQLLNSMVCDTMLLCAMCGVTTSTKTTRLPITVNYTVCKLVSSFTWN